MTSESKSPGKRLFIKTYGCQMNVYDSNRMADVLAPLGYGPADSPADADMVILLHRPDAFERDDPRGGEADLIVAKHRNGPTRTVTVAHQLHLSRFTNMARQ